MVWDDLDCKVDVNRPMLSIYGNFFKTVATAFQVTSWSWLRLRSVYTFFVYHIICNHSISYHVLINIESDQIFCVVWPIKISLLKSLLNIYQKKKKNTVQQGFRSLWWQILWKYTAFHFVLHLRIQGICCNPLCNHPRTALIQNSNSDVQGMML